MAGWDRLLGNLLRRFVRKGKLRLIDAEGREHLFGGTEEGPSVTVRLHDRALERKLFLNPELIAGEAYMDGTLTFEDGSGIYDLLHLFSVNREPLGSHPVQGILRQGWKAMRRRHQRNTVERAKAQARSHYDLSTDLYRLFLDDGLNYTCAYFTDPDMSLEAAQDAKLTHVIAKLRLEPGMKVLELGSGWGSFAIRMAEMGCDVVALNVSGEQVAVARDRAEAAGVADRCRFLVKDYREFEGSFDRVASIGIMEHVGVGHYEAFFDKISGFLAPRGYAFVHSIGRMSPPGTTGPFIRKYIFPGGYVPALSEVFQALERRGLWCADMEVLRLHYAWTIRHWRERFTANRDYARALYDERFCRMWEFYLGAVELGFLHGSNMVFQMLLSIDRDAVPVTRDFIVDDERKLLVARASDREGDAA